MARTKTTEMSTITAAQLADGDWVPVVDVSDTTMSSTGTNKKLAKSQLAEAAGVTAHAAVTSGVHGISTFGATLVDDADAAAARSTLGLGTIATQSAGAVAITGGSVAGITDLAIADGGTGGSTAAAALANLTSSTLAADGDILTRSGGVPAPITRADLATDAAFASRFGPLSSLPSYPHKATWYRSLGAPSNGASILSEGQALAVPWPVRAGKGFDRIGVYCTVVGSAGAVVRLARLSDSDGDGVPDTIVEDYGTVDATATGLLTIAIDWTPSGDDLFWAAAVVQGSAVTRPTLAITSGSIESSYSILRPTASVNQYAQNGYYQNGITGAMSGAFTPAGPSGSCFVISVRCK